MEKQWVNCHHGRKKYFFSSTEYYILSEWLTSPGLGELNSVFKGEGQQIGIIKEKSKEDEKKRG